MMADLAEEASNLRGRLGFQGSGWIRAMPVYLVLIGIFGVFLPWQKGRDFLDSVILGAYACLGVVFAAPIAASGFEQDPITTSRALARVGISVLYGEMIAATLLILGIGTAYLSRGGRIVVGPDLLSLAECAGLGVALSLAVCMVAVWTSVRFSPKAAKGVVRLIFLGLLAAFYLRSGWLPLVAMRATGIALLASLVFFLVLRATLGSRHA
jgi:predicted small integral membrane protein